MLFYKMEGNRIVPMREVNQLLTSAPIGIYEDAQLHIWVYTYSGVYMLPNIDAAAATAMPLLENKVVSKVIQDLEGNYWFSTLGQGVYMAPNIFIKQIKIESLENTNSSIVHLAKKGKDQLVLGTKGNMHPVMTTCCAMTKVLSESTARTSSIPSISKK